MERDLKSYLDTQIKDGDNGDFDGFAAFLKAAHDASTKGQFDQRLAKFTGGSKVMAEGTGAGGGFLVPTQQSAELFSKALESSVLFQRCTILPMTTDRLEVPVIAETTRAGGTVHGGIAPTWYGEAATIADTTPTFGKVILIPKKLAGVARISSELLMDSRPAAEVILERLFSEAIGWTLDQAILNGNGALQPLGIMNSPALITQAAEGGQPADTIVWLNLVRMFTQLPDSSKNSSSTIWIANGDCMGQLLTIAPPVGTAGVLAFIAPGEATQSLPTKIFGKNLYFSEHCQTLGDAGDLVLADMKEYLVGLRLSLTIDMSKDIYFLSDEIAFRYKLRVDGQTWWQNTLSPEHGAAVSPFVALGERA